MTDASDMELVRNYTQQGSEAAFAELVRRHINLVFSVALRRVGIVAHAEEITQAVFIILTRKAAALRPDTVLEGWLHETTRLTASSFLRGERRRQRREQEAYMQSTLHESDNVSVWNQMSPLLDEAISRLAKKDRDAVVLRFFKEQKLSEVAVALQVTEGAAQRRVHRALEKLRDYFNQRGVSLTTAIIVGELSANSVQAAPVALAKSVTAVAVVKGATASISTLTLIKGAFKIMAWTKVKTGMVIGALLVAAGTTPVVINEIHHYVEAHPHPRTTPVTETIRGQLFGLTELVDAGNTTPEAAWESRYWARAKGDYQAVIAATEPQALTTAKSWMGDQATFRARSQNEFASLEGFQMLARKDLARDRVELKYQFLLTNSSTLPETKIVLMVKANNAWRCAETRLYDANWDADSQLEPEL